MFVLGGHCENQDWRWSRNGFNRQKHHCCQSLSLRKMLWKQRQSWSSGQIWCWQWIYLEQDVGLGELQRSFPTLIILWFCDSNLNPVSDILSLHQAFACISFSTNTKLRSKCSTEIEALWTFGMLNIVKSRSHPHNFYLLTKLFFIIFCLIANTALCRLLNFDLLQFVSCRCCEIWKGDI